MRIFYFLCFAIAYSTFVTANDKDSWAQNTLSTMTSDEKIGQLFMIAGYVDPEFAKKETHNSEMIYEIDRYIKDYYVGGIAFVGASESSKQVALTNHYQEISKYPILIAQDLEWGLSMRLKDGLRFPKNITLGAIENDELIYKMGEEIGAQAKLIGVHMNLSPVLDVNVEPENIVINVRSFGACPHKVAEKGIAMIRGLQDAGIIASAKHFPGLGDITVDPHLDLPYSPHDINRLHSVEFYPFDKAIKAGVLSIQTEHLMVPAFDPINPASLSPIIVTDILKNELGFKGLVISGALRMKALTNYLSQEEIVLKAFLAGSDMLLMPQDFPKAYETLKTALDDGIINQQQIDERVLKILEMKALVKLDEKRFVVAPTQDQLQSVYAKQLKAELYSNAVRVLRNSGLIPLANLNGKSVAYIQLGDSPSKIVLDSLEKFADVDTFFFPIASDNSLEEQRLFQQLDKYSLVVLTIYPVDPRRISEIRLLNEKKQEKELKDFRVHGLTESMIKLCNALQKNQDKIVLTYFGNPFGLHYFDEYSNLIMGYEDDPDTQKAALKLL